MREGHYHAAAKPTVPDTVHQPPRHTLGIWDALHPEVAANASQHGIGTPARGDESWPEAPPAWEAVPYRLSDQTERELWEHCLPQQDEKQEEEEEGRTTTERDVEAHSVAGRERSQSLIDPVDEYVVFTSTYSHAPKASGAPS